MNIITNITIIIMREVNTYSCREVFTVVGEGDVRDGVSGEVEWFGLQVVE